LGIVSYKCRREVPYEEAVETIPMVYEDMMDRNLHIGFSIEEAYEAFHKGYKPDYVRASWKYLCELLGWEYRPNKRNGRKREEHLKLARKMKEIRCKSRWEELEEHIKRLIEQGYTKTEIAGMVGVSRRTLYYRFAHLWKK
jgi:DNA-binding NtrC family response regulator